MNRPFCLQNFRADVQTLQKSWRVSPILSHNIHKNKRKWTQITHKREDVSWESQGLKEFSSPGFVFSSKRRTIMIQIHWCLNLLIRGWQPPQWDRCYFSGRSCCSCYRTWTLYLSATALWALKTDKTQMHGQNFSGCKMFLSGHSSVAISMPTTNCFGMTKHSNKFVGFCSSPSETLRTAEREIPLTCIWDHSFRCL